MSPVHRNRFWLVLGLTLTALKLWLSRGQGVYAIAGAGDDDPLYIELAQHLVRGEWLGPYHDATLAHGSFYPLFIAAAFWLGVPLFLFQHLFYAAACGLFVRALAPAVTSAGARLAIYTLLLINPMTVDGPSMGRLLRQQVDGPLVLMIFAGLIALYLRRTEPARRQTPWVLLLGLGFAAFYLSGATMLWIVPSTLLLAGAYLFGSWKISRAVAQRAAGCLAATLVVAALPMLVVCAKNQLHYGRFATSESRAPAYLADGQGSPPGLGSVVDFVVSFSRFSARVPPSTGSPEELQLFRDLTHERLSPPVGELDRVGGDRYLLNLWKVDGLQRIGKALRPVLLVLFCLAQLGWVLRVGQAAARRQWTYPLTVATAAWGACAASLLTQAGLDSTALNIAAFAPTYLLLLVFISTTLWDAGTAWSKPGAWSRRAINPVRSTGEESAGAGAARLFG